MNVYSRKSVSAAIAASIVRRSSFVYQTQVKVDYKTEVSKDCGNRKLRARRMSRSTLTSRIQRYAGRRLTSLCLKTVKDCRLSGENEGETFS